MERAAVDQWVDGYVRAWRTAGTDALADLFTPEIIYLPSPWAEPVEGLAALAKFWESERDGPDEVFRFRSALVALDSPTAVIRVSVDYAQGTKWRDLWVVTFTADRRCSRFEEWPFAPNQSDGHSPSSPR